MLLSKFKFSSLLRILALTIAPLSVDASTCFEIADSDNFNTGICTIKTTWQKITYHKDDEVSGEPAIRDRIASEIFDSRGTKISAKNMDDFQWCRGYQGQECEWHSSLPFLVLVSPQHRIEYLQFWFGDIGWHTNPNPSEGPKYLGDDVKDKRPWCGVYTDWEPIPSENGRFLGDPGIRIVELLHKVEIGRVLLSMRPDQCQSTGIQTMRTACTTNDSHGYKNKAIYIDGDEGQNCNAGSTCARRYGYIRTPSELDETKVCEGGSPGRFT
ncbi:uncharacterized protein DFL_008144 [Arthrobotrys flagrans]|uniref:Ecp2 effector protein domain-containing protein n=1 Tax=Arthrobotrys flagrans TaxID=97331 RepID=A0A436ZN32_ARTFL|nr:hypothetical protein DFL_008144 [Arthrobotrys flagrans]